MYLFIIATLITLTIAYLIGNDESPFDWGSFIGANVVGVILYLVITVVIIVCMDDNDKLHVNEYKDQPILSFHMDKESHISGNFVLGCGTIDGGSYDTYVSYAQFPEGLLRVKCDAYVTYLNEKDSIPTIKKYWVRDNFKGFKSNWVWSLPPKTGKWVVNYGTKTIIVPKNTVYLEFKTVE